MRVTRTVTAGFLAVVLLTPLGVGTAASNNVPLRGDTVKEFATRFERTLSNVLDGLLPRLGKVSVTGGRREKLLSLSLRAGGGTVRVQGLGLLLPSPRRYDLTLRFEDVSEPGAGKRLSIDGTMQFDLIAHGKDADGLFRGVMRLGGRFRGSPEVYGEVINGNVVSLVAESGGDSFRVGKRKPQKFLSYTKTLAGNGTEGDSDGRRATARFSSPQGLAVDEGGMVWVADTDNGKIRRITPTGNVTTVASGLEEPTDVGIDPFGDLIVSQRFSLSAPLGRIDPETGEVTPIVFNRTAEGENLCGLIISSCEGRSPIATMEWPNGIDVQGNITYVAQGHYPPSIRMVLPDGTVTTIRDSAAGGRDGGDCGNAGIVGGNSDVAKGRNGEIFYLIEQVGCYGVLALQPDGTVRTVAGNLEMYGNQDGTGDEARFFNPTDLAFDGIRYLYVSDSGNNLIRRVDVDTGAVVRVAGCIPHAPGFDCGPQSLRDGSSKRAQFYLPDGIDIDEWGDLYVTDLRNHSVRLIRIVTDPVRDPSIDSFSPYAVEQGASTTLEVKGRNLGLVETASLGEGVAVTVQNAGSRRLLLHVEVDPLAAAGPRTLSIQTPYGTVQGASTMSLEILEAGISGAVVSTIAGTGSWFPGIHDGPAEKSQIGFPAGMDIVDEGRVLVADTVEQRVRMIATRKGATDEIVELMLHASVERDTLDPILTGLQGLGQVLSALGIENELDNASEASLGPIVSQAIDEWCNLLDGDCEWLSLPWAGVPMVPGDSGGIRLQAKVLLPTDVVKAGEGLFYVADTGNQKVKVVGSNPGPEPAVDAPFQMFGTASLNERPFSVAPEGGEDTALVGMATSSLIERVVMNSGGEETDAAGVENGLRCIRAVDDPRQPMGLPFGMDFTTDATFVADAYCQTVWRIDNETGDVTDMRGDARQDGTDIGTCSDGPISFATFGAPMDVSVDPNGNIWVADAACNSIRVITDLDKDQETLATELGDYLNGVAGHLPGPVADQIETKLAELDEDFLATNRWWVLTVAGANDGQPGFADGPASQALFDAPVALEVAHQDGQTIVFVSDVANHRIRMIEAPQL